jgi:hypothetical protein
MGRIRKIRKHEEARDRSGKFKRNKKERMEERKRRDFLHTWRFPYSSCVLHWLGTSSAYLRRAPCVTLLQENFPLVWEPPLEQN